MVMEEGTNDEEEPSRDSFACTHRSRSYDRDRQRVGAYADGDDHDR